MSPAEAKKRHLGQRLCAALQVVQEETKHPPVADLPGLVQFTSQVCRRGQPLLHAGREDSRCVQNPVAPHSSID